MITLGLKNAFRRFNQTMRKLRHPEIRATPCGPELGDHDEPCAVQILYDCNYHKPDQGMSERSDFETQDEAEVFLHGWCCGLDFKPSPRTYNGRPVVPDTKCPKCDGLVLVDKTVQHLVCINGPLCGLQTEHVVHHHIPEPIDLGQTAGEILEHQYGEDFGKDFTVEEDEETYVKGCVSKADWERLQEMKEDDPETYQCRHCGLDCDESGVCDRCYKKEMER